ncbi:MAG TPA: DEAD/DEAH box helicase [Acidimicrobiales bacterium]|nr:DEAD/DEAH box helicase [Acidimicrobiales bacterium]
MTPPVSPGRLSDPDVDFVALLRATDTEGQLVHLERLPARPAEHGEPRRPLHPALTERLPPLWRHQVEALDLIRAGRSTAIATGTASGKTLCYLAPIAEAVLTSPTDATALLLYPTKALAHDQLRAVGELDVPGLVAATYDGDTDPDMRTWVRRNANVVLTNPDMLHAGILPNHARWATFLMRLRYVVLDELHTLRGIFGTHIAHVVRRLQRLCALYGAAPTFVFGSATVGAPGRLASMICGHDVAEVTDDASPRGERLFALWNPPLLEERSGARGSGNHETARLLSTLVAAGSRTIAFTRSRKGAEVVAVSARRMLDSTGHELAATVRPYRGGYLPHERREIEAELFGGRLLGVSATNALELGIDVGGLDACILNGFPGTIASMWQQAGRAGRTAARSLAVLVAGDDALDQWFMSHPRELFSRPPEPGVVNPSNPYVLDAQLACAAYELPLTPGDERFWGDDIEDGVRRLVVNDDLRLREGRAVYAGRDRPSATVGLRTGTSAEVSIVDAEGNAVGTVDLARAFTAVHPGAVYLHQGQHHRVERLDLDDRVAWVVPTDADETTQARSATSVRILEEEKATTVGRAALALGAVEITDQVTGYRRRSLLTGEALGDEELDLPPTTLTTRAFWYTFDPTVFDDAALGLRRWPGTLHAAEHAGIGMLPLFTICDRWDVGGVSTPLQADTGLPTIVIYDGYPGGAGIAELGFEAGARHLRSTLDAIAGCGCESGCPSCVQSPKCGNLNEPLDKPGAIALLRVVLT